MSPETPDDDDLCFWSACRVAAAIRTRQVSPVQVYEAIDRRIRRVNPLINGYVTLDLDRARDAAREAQEALVQGREVGPLHGVPVAVKDDLAVAGLRYTCGSNLLRDHVADTDDLAVERIKRAGAVILGKTNLPEFGHKGTTDNLLFGATNNPWNTSLVAGGSSGGSAAVVAAGMAYLALGTDIGGSIRVPASCCGVVGHKPSLGRIPRFPVGNFFNTAWTAGPLARTVEDAALGLRVLAGPDQRDPFSLPPLADGELALEGDLRGLRVGLCPSPTGTRVETVVADAVAGAVAGLRSLGVEVVPVGVPDPELVPTLKPAIDRMLGGDSMLVFVLAGQVPRWRYWRLRLLGLFSAHYRLSPSFDPIARRGFYTSLPEYITAQKELTDFVEGHVARLFEGIDVLASPTIALPPFPHPGVAELGPERVAGQIVDRHIGWMFTWPFNLSGQPAVSVRCGWTADGLPIGLQLVGRRCQDGLVLRVAAAIERGGPGGDRRPSL